MKGLLLFVAGLLVGANVVYFLLAGQRAPCPSIAPAAAPAAANAMPAPAPAQPPVAASTAVAAAAVVPGPSTTPAAMAPMPAAQAPAPSGLLLPVAGIRADQLTDTYNQTRGGARIHEALDIMAPRGTPVLAAIDGTVEKLFTSVPGGLTIYEFDPARTHAYYYAHLDRYAPGLAEGKALRRGDVIGYVGSTGNASFEAPHLHFAIFVLGPDKHWWQGTPINPYPLLGGR